VAGFEDLKLDEQQFEGRNVQSMPDNPSEAGWSADDVKRGMDEAAMRVVALERLNALLDRLGDVNAGTQIGVVSQDGEPSTVQNEFNKTFARHITAGAGDMMREIYDPNLNGKVDDSEKLGGKTLEEIYESIYPVGSIYLSVSNVNPSGMFGGAWELYKPGRTLVCVDIGDGDFNAPEKIGGSKALQSHAHSGKTSEADVSHTHPITIAAASTAHTHGMNHTHSGTTAAGGSHDHGIYSPGYGYPPPSGGSDRYCVSPNQAGAGVLNAIATGGSHQHNVTTDGPSNGSTASGGGSHAHTGTVGGDNRAHTHSFSTGNAGSGQSQNLQPFATCYMWVRRA